jgi:hypothetical protein
VFHMPAPVFAASSPEDGSGKLTLWSSTSASSLESRDSSLQCTPIPPSPTPSAQPNRVISLPPGCRLVTSSPALQKTVPVRPGLVQPGLGLFMSRPATSSTGSGQQPSLVRPATSWPVQPRLVTSSYQYAQPRLSPAQPILLTSSPAQARLVMSSPAQPRLVRPVITIPVQRRASSGTFAEGLDEPDAYDNLDGAGCSHW